MKETEKFTKYEKARILGARALQISMDAPLLLKINEEELIELNYDPLKIAEKELSLNVLPITVKKPLPEKGDEKEIQRIKIEETSISDDKKIREEEKEEKEIIEERDIMKLAESDDEMEEKVKLEKSRLDSDEFEEFE